MPLGFGVLVLPTLTVVCHNDWDGENEEILIRPIFPAVDEEFCRASSDCSASQNQAGYTRGSFISASLGLVEHVIIRTRTFVARISH